MIEHQKPFLKLFSQIKNCKKCPCVQSEKVIRRIEKVNLSAGVMVISEAMAASQVRLSGVNFFDVEGKLGNTGKMLQRFLEPLGLSVDPDCPNCIYNTEIVHCFPGYSRSGAIRRPTDGEIGNCVRMGFIDSEISLLSPNIIILMGKTSYETFYEYFLRQKVNLGLSAKIESIKMTKKFDTYKGIPLIPIQHASGANPRFLSMVRDDEYMRIISDILNQTV